MRVTDLVELLRVSDMTVRRDLVALHREGLLEKFRLMVDTARQVNTLSRPVSYGAPTNDWELLNSRN